MTASAAEIEPTLDRWTARSGAGPEDDDDKYDDEDVDEDEDEDGEDGLVGDTKDAITV